jgi:hypothetical protein
MVCVGEGGGAIGSRSKDKIGMSSRLNGKTFTEKYCNTNVENTTVRN